MTTTMNQRYAILAVILFAVAGAGLGTWGEKAPSDSTNNSSLTDTPPTPTDILDTPTENSAAIPPGTSTTTPANTRDTSTPKTTTTRKPTETEIRTSEQTQTPQTQTPQTRTPTLDDDDDDESKNTATSGGDISINVTVK